MKTVPQYLRNVAQSIMGAKKGPEIEEIKIYFSAPDPHRPSTKTLTLESEKMDEANFYWRQYAILFTDAKEDWHIYLIPLHPWGEKKPGGEEVIQSDSLWSVKRDETPSLTSKEVEKLFPEILKGPELFPSRGYQVSYINSHKSDKKEDYSPEEFRRNFDNTFYTVLTKNKMLENPFGKPLGTKGGEPGKTPPGEK